MLDIDPQETDEGLRVRSSVQGSAVYEQEIHVSHFMDAIEVEGECTCPVGYNCKHVAAVLTSMLEEARPAPLARQRQQIEDWVTRVAAARTPEQWLPELGEQTLLYVLTPSPRQTRRVEVQLQISRVLKNGKGYGKPRTLGVYELQGTRMQQVARRRRTHQLDGPKRHRPACARLEFAQRPTADLPDLEGAQGALWIVWVNTPRRQRVDLRQAFMERRESLDRQCPLQTGTDRWIRLRQYRQA